MVSKGSCSSGSSTELLRMGRSGTATETQTRWLLSSMSNGQSIFMLSFWPVPSGLQRPHISNMLDIVDFLKEEKAR